MTEVDYHFTPGLHVAEVPPVATVSLQDAAAFYTHSCVTRGNIYRRILHVYRRYHCQLQADSQAGTSA